MMGMMTENHIPIDLIRGVYFFVIEAQFWNAGLKSHEAGDKPETLRKDIHNYHPGMFKCSCITA